jgi:hypothetical protein
VSFVVDGRVPTAPIGFPANHRTATGSVGCGAGYLVSAFQVRRFLVLPSLKKCIKSEGSRAA